MRQARLIDRPDVHFRTARCVVSEAFGVMSFRGPPVCQTRALKPCDLTYLVAERTTSPIVSQVVLPKFASRRAEEIEIIELARGGSS